jgi:carboxymethylenebutenolidase
MVPRDSDLQNDAKSLMPDAPLTRRTFTAAAAVTGFALAVQPVAASTITTDSEGLDAGWVSIPVGDREIPGYRAKPKGVTLAPTVIVVHEVFGVHEHIQDLCRRLAKEGYYAIAPSFFERQGDVTKAPNLQALLPLVSAKPDAEILSDLDWTVAFLSKDGGTTTPLAITGYCWGGRVTWLYAAHSPYVTAGVAWYGRLVGDSTPLQPKHPIDLAGQLKAPVLGLYGGNDQGIPNDTVERMNAALKAAGSESFIHLYPGAPHGFLADYRPSYTPDVAKDSWAKMLAWFRQHGVGWVTSPGDPGAQKG